MLKPGGGIPPARAAVAVERLPGSEDSAETPVDGTPMNGMNLLEALKTEPWYVGQAVHVAQVGSRTAGYASPSAELHPLLKEVLVEIVQGDAAGALQLYNHQAEAIDAVLVQKTDIVVSTSTGSGKSLVYLVAIFDALLRDENATAFLIFPTKALAQAFFKPDCNPFHSVSLEI